MNNNSPVLYTLECEHVAPGPPTLVNGMRHCAWCMTPKAITGIVEYEWRAKCQNCTFTRWAGLSKHNAGIFATGHVRHCPEHAVTVDYSRNPQAVRTAEKFAKWQDRKAG